MDSKLLVDDHILCDKKLEQGWEAEINSHTDILLCVVSYKQYTGGLLTAGNPVLDLIFNWSLSK